MFFFDAFIKSLTFFIKIKINENIYKKFDYSINKWLFLFYYFLIYIVSGIFPILSLIILGCFEKNDKNLEYIEKYENNNNNNDEEIELLIKVNESTVNFFGNIYYKYKRLKEKKKQNEFIEDFDINLTEIKKNVKDNEKINKILYSKKNYKKIEQLEQNKIAQTESDKTDKNKNVKDAKNDEAENDKNNQTESDIIEEIKNETLNKAVENIINRKSPFRLEYEKEGIIKYFL